MPAELQANASLNALNAFGVNATAAWLAKVQCESELAPVLADRRVAGWPQLVLGGGTNILFASDFPGLVVRVGIPGLRAAGQTGDSWLFEIGAGMDWHHTVQSLLQAGVGGVGNPGPVPRPGGAPPVPKNGAPGPGVPARLHSV